MAVIVFGMFPAAGHYNATFRLARDLQRRGHRVVYVDEESNAFESTVAAQGFEFRRMLKEPGESMNAAAGRVPFFERFRQNRRLIGIDNDLSHRMVRKLLQDVKPDLIILDINCLHHVLLLHQYPVKTALLQTMMPLDKRRFVPPLSSSIVPRKTFTSFLAVELAWLRYFTTRYVTRLRDRIRLRGLDRDTVFSTLAKLNGFPLGKNLNTGRAFFAGFKNVPELILSPREFDFPAAQADNQYCIGPSVDFDRHDVQADPGFRAAIKQIGAVKKATGMPVVYCSLGTLSADHYDQCAKFLGMVIDAVKNTETCLLILATGERTELSQAYANIPNVFLFKTVPQVQALQAADVMITHGGMNTLNECILSEVPVLVYPLNDLWDQNGNAARVVYHKIGLRGNIRSASVKKIQRELSRLLGDNSFRANITAMKKRILDNAHFSAGVKVIEAHLLPESENDARHQAMAGSDFTRSIAEL